MFQAVSETMPEPGASLLDSPDHAARLSAAIADKSARVAVIGLGYVGLPMAVAFVQAGFTIVGIDASPERCAQLRAGRSHVEDLADAPLQAALAAGTFSVSSEWDCLAQADVILICVPTPLRKSKDPDLTAVLAAARAVAEHLRPGQLIVLESTTYPGTTEEVLLPMFSDKGLHVGRDFWLAFSPERVDPGNPNYGVHNITKLVGACTPAGTELAAQFYRQAIANVVPVSSTRVAEAAKLLENTFRSVNIALANEMAVICRHLGVDVWEVIEAAATKPFGFMAHYPGPGIGGHCIPLDPHYLSWRTRLQGYEPKFISLATEINGAMPGHVVNLVAEGLNDAGRSVRGSRILILGVAYKANVADTRESPALEILTLLARRGGQVDYCDPHVPAVTLEGNVLQSQILTSSLVRQADCVVITTNHRDFDYEMIVREAALVLDTRNATRRWPHHGNVRFL